MWYIISCHRPNVPWCIWIMLSLRNPQNESHVSWKDLFHIFLFDFKGILYVDFLMDCHTINAQNDMAFLECPEKTIKNKLERGKHQCHYSSIKPIHTCSYRGHHAATLLEPSPISFVLSESCLRLFSLQPLKEYLSERV